MNIIVLTLLIIAIFIIVSIVVITICITSSRISPKGQSSKYRGYGLPWCLFHVLFRLLPTWTCSVGISLVQRFCSDRNIIGAIISIMSITCSILIRANYYYCVFLLSVLLLLDIVSGLREEP